VPRYLCWPVQAVRLSENLWSSFSDIGLSSFCSALGATHVLVRGDKKQFLSWLGRGVRSGEVCVSPSRGRPIGCRFSLAVSAVSGFVPPAAHGLQCAAGVDV